MPQFNFQAFDLKEEIKSVIKIDPGRQRGGDLLYMYKYIRSRKGAGGVEKVTEEMKNAGFAPPDFSTLDDLDWIPSSWATIFMLACVKAFAWREEDLFEMGKGAISMHTLAKVFIRFFSSIEKTFTLAAQSWHKHYSFGQLEVAAYDGENKQVTVWMKNFKKHPVTCVYLQGFFSKIIEIATGSNQVRARETKCEFNGDDRHEFVLTW